MVKMEIDLLPEAFIQYLYNRLVVKDEFFDDLPCVKDGFLLIESKTPELTLDYYFGRLTIIQRLKIKRRYQSEEEFHICECSQSESSILRKITEHKLNIVFVDDRVRVSAPNFTSMDQIELLGLCVLKTVLKDALSSITVDMEDDLVVILNEYLEMTAKIASKRIVLH